MAPTWAVPGLFGHSFACLGAQIHMLVFILFICPLRELTVSHAVLGKTAFLPWQIETILFKRFSTEGCMQNIQTQKSVYSPSLSS